MTMIFSKGNILIFDVISLTVLLDSEGIW